MTSFKRRVSGERLPPLRFVGIQGEPVTVPGAGLVHLQFRRFAGCPVCNLHLQTFSRAQPRLADAGILTVAFFHSTTEQMEPYQGQLPFPCVADPERRWYEYFGVERSLLAVAHPRVLAAALKGLLTAPSNPFVGGAEPNGLPADFLIDRRNVIVAAKYGAHADDQWSVDELLALAELSQGPSTSLSGPQDRSP
jgi:hypothetical protein